MHVIVLKGYFVSFKLEIIIEEFVYLCNNNYMI